jgi:2'-deoxynucleoside 5'-phosphate N-hydrolase
VQHLRNSVNFFNVVCQILPSVCVNTMAARHHYIFITMRAYISVGFNERKLLDKEIIAITGTLTELKISSLVFVNKYKFDLSQERQMMEQAMAEIDNCDMLIAETSYKNIGIGIEAGYAKAKGKIIIYLRQKDTEHSTTVSGISDYKIIYTDATDLKKQLADTIDKITCNL